MTHFDIDSCFEFICDLARKAGKIIKDDFQLEKFDIETKQGFADLVTKSDTKVEKFIFGAISEKYPDHRLIGEESTTSACELSDHPTWIVDPIDGTTNFVHRFPYTAVSIAFYINKKTEIGIVFNPIRNELFSAKRGGGATLNGKKISVNGAKELGTSLVCAEFGLSRQDDVMDINLQNMRNIINKCHGIRIMGSAALAMTMVAMGRTDVYYQVGPHCWDFAAGDLIVREAGGHVCNTDGSKFDVMSRRVLCASTEELINQIAPLITSYNFKRDDC